MSLRRGCATAYGSEVIIGPDGIFGTVETVP